MAEWFELLRGTGQWIWASPTADTAPFLNARTQLALLHATLTPPEGTRRIELHLSAVGRYTLWLDDEREPLGRGPARSDPAHHSLDTCDIEIEGVPKPLQLWAQVRWSAGVPESPVAEIPSPFPAFLAIALFLDASGRILSKTGTSTDWRTCPCPPMHGPIIRRDNTYYAIGTTERQLSSAWPADWRKSAPPTSPRWQPAVLIEEPCFKNDPLKPSGTYGTPWLAQREIPYPEERPLLLRDVRRGSLTEIDPHHLRVPPGETLRLRCDMGEEVLAYFRIRLRGLGATLRIGHSESLLTPANKKSFSLENGTPLAPVVDEFHMSPDGPSEHTFDSFHWRAFRFLDITLEAPAGGSDAELETLELLGTGYPFDPDYALDLKTDDPPLRASLQKMVDVSWRTLKCCTWETYMDCPHYEQLQYIGDTRLQCLLTYITTGDLSLPVQALRAFDRSRLPEGLTQSRYPSAVPQIIPTFSLIYILMIEDYLLHAGDEALVAELRPGIAPILNWFTQHTSTDTGLIGYTPYWPFIDWVNGWPRGIPPHAGDAPGVSRSHSGASASVNLLYLLALQSATRIYDRAKPGSGNFYASRAAALKQRLYDAFFDRGRGLMCDVPIDVGRGKVGVWSQHAQALAILADVLSPSEARRAMLTAIDVKNVLWPDEPVSPDKNDRHESRFIAPASFYFLFYIAEALAQLRLGEHIWPLLAPFRAALANGSNTWPESFEPSRSECHAWSAWPLYFFARHALGIGPPSLEDNRIRVRPLFCPPLDHLVGRFQTHRGPVDVEVRWEDNKRFVDAAGAGVEVQAE